MVKSGVDRRPERAPVENPDRRARRYVVGSLAAAFAVLMATLSASTPVAAASPTAVEVDFSTTTALPYHNYGEAQIRIQNPEPEAAQLIADSSVRFERAFVRLDQWKPERNDDLNTDPNIKFTLGDTWLQDMNARGVAPWLTQENLPDWMKAPLNDSELADYEQLWYEIVLHIKQTSPQLEVVEMFNEPNLTKFKLRRSNHIDLYVANARVVNRINDELGLPKPGVPKLISGGPSYTFAAAGGSLMRTFMDKLYAMPDFEEIKPAFISWHSFANPNNPSALGAQAEKIRAYMSNAKFNGAWDNVEQWVTAYGQSSCLQNTKNPTAFNMMKHATFMATAHHHFMDSGIDRASLFAAGNYRCYDGTVVFPEPVGDGKPISWADPGMRTPMYNALEMMAALDSGRRVESETSGPNAMNKNGQGVGVEATRGRGEAKVLLWNYRTNSGTKFHAETAIELTGLADACIADDEPAIATVTVLDDQNGNVAAGDHTDDTPNVLEPIVLPPGQVRTLDVSLRNGGMALVEISRPTDADPIPASCAPSSGPSTVTVEGNATRPTVSVTTTSGGALVEWEAFAGADAYRVRHRKAGDKWSTAPKTFYSEPTLHVISGLTNGQRYNVAVGARVNGKWQSKWTVVNITPSASD